MANHERKILTISGVKVMFPCKPYPSQFSMMDRVIKGLQRKQNCLLESPTGSGKSLALLCSALAWQCTMNEKLTRDSMQAAEASYCNPCTCGADQADKLKEYSPESKPAKEYSPESKPAKVPGSPVGSISDKPIEILSDEDDDFKPSGNFRTPTAGQAPSSKRGHIQIEYEKEPPSTEQSATKCICNKDSSAMPKKKPKLPKIYFCTRTHKQIAQIVRELGKTEYHDVKMAILGSREHCCVHPEVSKMKNKNEGCRERLDGPGCKFKEKASRVFLCQSQIQDALPTAWDLEDLVKACKTKQACPYFVTKNVVEQANIIFCPYNYLIDPLVRKSMDINLKEQIVILDEAHNIEDSAREAAGGSMTTDQINQAVQDLNMMCEQNVKFADHVAWKNTLEHLLHFIEGNSKSLKSLDYDTSYEVWEGFDIVARLKNVGLGPDQLNEHKQRLERISASEEEAEKSVRNRFNQEVKLHMATLKLLELLVQVLDYMYRNDMQYVEDFRIAIVRSMQLVPNRDTNNTWIGKNRRAASREVVFTLNFWCMNPAVAFTDFNCCRNVVLSSGTLSPMSTFASELGAPFPIQLEANHVIEDKQVWVGAVGQGPSGVKLEAVFKNKETYTFQDELGALILAVCEAVPHGVLCFLSSYRDLEKFVKRWKATNLWSRISRRKRILVEPRASDKEEFDYMMKAFYDVIKGNTCSHYLDQEDMYEDDTDIDGALFIAVCRGKVSEGMDFADNNARAVITVGIPFPNIKDLQIQQKKTYNDRHKASRGLLSGNEWYEIQAFRALNQALGRCIRHRKDWGALIVVDDRFVKKPDKYCKGLSKWVRSKVVPYEHFGMVTSSLDKFTSTMQKEMPEVDPDTSFIPCTPCTPGTSRRESVYCTQQLDSSILNQTGGGHDTSIYFSPRQDLSQSLTPSPDLTRHPNKASAFSPLHMHSSVNKSNQDTVANNTPVKPNKQAGLASSGLAGQASGLPGQVSGLPGLASGLSGQASGLPGQASGLPGQTSGLPGQASGLPGQAGQATPGQPTTLVLPASSNTTLTIQQQLVEAIKSGKVPRDRQCLVIMNQGQPDEMTLLVEPNKVGKSSSGATGKGEAGTSAQRKTHGVKTDLEVLKQPVLAPGQMPQQRLASPQGRFQEVQRLNNVFKQPVTPTGIRQEPRTSPYIVSPTGQLMILTSPSSSTTSTTNPAVQQFVLVPGPVLQNPGQFEATSTPSAEAKQEKLRETRNKFLKFVQVPKAAEAKVPVAMVMPQKMESTAESHEPPVQSGTLDEGPPAYDRKSNSPVLFSDVKEIPESEPEDEIEKSTSITDNTEEAAGRKKKPLFRKAATPADKHDRTSVDADSDMRGGGVKQSKEHGVGNDKSHSLDQSKRYGTRSNMRGSMNRSLIDQLRKVQQPSEDGRDENKLKEVQSPVTFADNSFEKGKVEDSDEEFLNTRRKGGVKRRSKGQSKGRAKRARGVMYEAEEDKISKENKRTDSLVSCFKCGVNWIKDADYVTGHKPDILEAKHQDVLSFVCMDSKMSSLQPHFSDSSGPQLNSVYDVDRKCCLQYLQCRDCGKHSRIVGARIVIADSTSEFKTGQTWILSSVAKT